jgi:hypothetical protein
MTNITPEHRAANTLINQFLRTLGIPLNTVSFTRCWHAP